MILLLFLTIFTRLNLQLNSSLRTYNIIQMSDSYDFQVIQSSYEIIQQSIRQDPKKEQKVKIFQVKIKPSKNQSDLNMVQNQYYQFQISKYGNKFLSLQRRYSQFALIFDILSKKEPGFIFPAFPQNGIFAFMKTKVTMIKDQEFIKKRIRVIERFFDTIFNYPQFNPQFCTEIKQFVSQGQQFQARKKIEKGSTGVIGYWNKFKTLLTISKENKYKQYEDETLKIKSQFQFLYIKCQELIQLIYEQQTQNEKMQQIEDPNEYFKFFKQLIHSHDLYQAENLKELQMLQFILFCENEDLLMVNKIIERMNELKKNEDNYSELKQAQQQFTKQIDKFIIQKTIKRKNLQDDLQQAIMKVKKVSRHTN